jgi:hypothetical protein
MILHGIVCCICLCRFHWSVVFRWWGMVQPEHSNADGRLPTVSSIRGVQ